MKLSDLTPEAIEDAIEVFYGQVSGHAAKVIHVVSLARYSIPQERRRLGAREFPYHLAADIDLVFRFALGEAEASSAHIESLCVSLIDLLHVAPAGRVEVIWDTFGETPLGMAVRACRARSRLRAEDGMVSGDELRLLSGLSKQKLRAAKLKRGPGGYHASDVRSLFAKEGVPA